MSIVSPFCPSCSKSRPTASWRRRGRPARRRQQIAVSAGNPSYAEAPASFGTARQTIALHEHFGFREEKFVVQLFDGRGELLDERVVRLPLALPRLVTRVERTALVSRAPAGMVAVPAGTFVFKTAGNPDDANPVIPTLIRKPHTLEMPVLHGPHPGCRLSPRPAMPADRRTS
jgi:hypothetical protein